MTPRLILVPDDFTPAATQALRFAGRLAERFEAHLLVIHADPLADFHVVPQKLADHVETNVNPIVPFDTQIVVDWPVEAIVNKACDTGADLIVIGPHARGNITRRLLGSVTEVVMRLANVPVLAMTSSSAPDAVVRKVLCPVDFTPANRCALRSAAGWFEEATLRLVRGCSDDLQASIHDLITLQDWAQDLTTRCAVEMLPHEMTPACVVDYATRESADLITLGVSESRFVEQVLRDSACPVLTINEATARKIGMEVCDVSRSARPSHQSA